MPVTNSILVGSSHLLRLYIKKNLGLIGYWKLQSKFPARYEYMVCYEVTLLHAYKERRATCFT